MPQVARQTACTITEAPTCPCPNPSALSTPSSRRRRDLAESTACSSVATAMIARSTPSTARSGCVLRNESTSAVTVGSKNACGNERRSLVAATSGIHAVAEAHHEGLRGTGGPDRLLPVAEHHDAALAELTTGPDRARAERPADDAERQWWLVGHRHHDAVPDVLAELVEGRARQRDLTSPGRQPPFEHRDADRRGPLEADQRDLPAVEVEDLVGVPRGQLDIRVRGQQPAGRLRGLRVAEVPHLHVPRPAAELGRGHQAAHARPEGHDADEERDARGDRDEGRAGRATRPSRRGQRHAHTRHRPGRSADRGEPLHQPAAPPRRDGAVVPAVPRRAEQRGDEQGPDGDQEHRGDRQRHDHAREVDPRVGIGPPRRAEREEGRTDTARPAAPPLPRTGGSARRGGRPPGPSPPAAPRAPAAWRDRAGRDPTSRRSADPRSTAPATATMPAST